MKVSEAYSTLFHYTNCEGLMGILDRGVLRATDYRYLNDSEELIYSKHVIRQILNPEIINILKGQTKCDSSWARRIEEWGGIESVAAKDAESLLAAMFDSVLESDQDCPRLTGPYIFSFCAHTSLFESKNGLLSQWRGYGKDGGYAIVFDVAELEKQIISELEMHYYPIGQFCDVGYGVNEFSYPEDLKEIVNEIRTSLPEALRNHAEKGFFNLKLFTPFVTTLSRIKHEGFKEEREVRIVLFPGSQELQLKEKDNAIKQKSIKPVYHRTKKGTPVPYIEILGGGGTSLLIKKVIIGPHNEKILRHKALKSRLDALGIELAISDIPFVG